MNELSVFVEDGGTTDVDQTAVQIDIVPGHVQNFRFPKGMERKENFDFKFVATNCIQKFRDFIRLQKVEVGRDNCGEIDMDSFAGLFGNHSGDEHPGIFQVFRTDLFGLLIDKLLPAVLRDLVDIHGHGLLEAVCLDLSIASDGLGRCCLPGIDIAVDGIVQCADTGQLLLFCSRFQSHGFLLCLFFCWPCDGYGFPIHLDADEPGAGWELTGFWEFHFFAFLFCDVIQVAVLGIPGNVRIFGIAEHAAILFEFKRGNVQGVNVGADTGVGAAGGMEFPGGGTMEHIGVGAVRWVQTWQTMGIQIGIGGGAGGREKKILAVGLTQCKKELVLISAGLFQGYVKFIDTICQGFICLRGIVGKIIPASIQSRPGKHMQIFGFGQCVLVFLFGFSKCGLIFLFGFSVFVQCILVFFF